MEVDGQMILKVASSGCPYRGVVALSTSEVSMPHSNARLHSDDTSVFEGKHQLQKPGDTLIPEATKDEDSQAYLFQMLIFHRQYVLLLILYC
jgi:hypothetical protein